MAREVRVPLLDDRNDNGVGCWPQRTYGSTRVGTCSDICVDYGEPGQAGHVLGETDFFGYELEVSQVWFGTPEFDGVDATATQAVGSFSQTAASEVYASASAGQSVGAFTQNVDADVTAGSSIEVSQVWLGIPESNERTLSATQTVGGFTQNADAAVEVALAAVQTVGGFTQTAAATVQVDATATQAVGAFGTSATAENDSPVVEPEAPARKTGGGGVPRGTRKVVVRIDDDEFVVSSLAEARALIAQAEALAEEAARAKAAELAARERVRMRAARRAAPVVRIETPEPVAEVEQIRDQVDAVNARLQQMYVEALRTALIAREIQRRLDEDEEEAITALLL